MRILYCPGCHKAGLKWDNPLEPPRGFDWGSLKRWCPRCQEWVEGIPKKVETHARPGKASRVRLR